MSLDLSLVSNQDWENIFIANETAQLAQGEGGLPGQYQSIPDKYVSANKHVLLIGISSASVRSHWWLGGRVTQCLSVNPSSIVASPPGVRTSDTRRLKVNSMTLVQFQNFGIVPYLLLIETPRWFMDVHIEVWKYLGFEDNDPTGNGNGSYDGGIY